MLHAVLCRVGPHIAQHFIWQRQQDTYFCACLVDADFAQRIGIQWYLDSFHQPTVGPVLLCQQFELALLIEILRTEVATTDAIRMTEIGCWQQAQGRHV